MSFFISLPFLTMCIFIVISTNFVLNMFLTSCIFIVISTYIVLQICNMSLNKDIYIVYMWVFVLPFWVFICNFGILYSYNDCENKKKCQYHSQNYL